MVSGQQHALAALYPRERPGTHCTEGWVLCIYICVCVYKSVYLHIFVNMYKYICILQKIYLYFTDTQWRSWLRHCDTSRKVAGSIPDGVNGFFIDSSGHTMALGRLSL